MNFEKIKNYLNKFGYIMEKELLRGFLFFEKNSNSALMIDCDICNSKNPFSYTQYTKEQNLLMHKFNSLYRFSVDDEEDLEEFKMQFDRIMGNDLDEENLKSSGTNRNLKEIDPSIPEAYFEQAFIEIFGNDSLDSVLREEPFIDINSQTNYINYLVHTKNGKVPIEKNGETYR